MKTIVNRLPLTKARVNLGQVVRRVHVNREFFILEKDGIPVVGLMHVDDLEDYLEMQNRSVKEQIQTQRCGLSPRSGAQRARVSGRPENSDAASARTRRIRAKRAKRVIFEHEKLQTHLRDCHRVSLEAFPFVRPSLAT